MIEDEYLNARFERIEIIQKQLAQNIEILKETIEYMGEGDINEILKESRNEFSNIEEDNEKEFEKENENKEEEKEIGKRASKPKKIEE